MRQAMRGLTTRGRSFLGAGLAAAVCSLLFGQSDLLRIAVLVVALPLVSAFLVSRTRYRVASSRRLEPVRTPAGSSARVVLRLENVSRLPTGLLLLEDQVPLSLGARPRFLLDRVEAQGVREVSYDVRSDVRGSFAVGPLTIRLTDPFGMCELVRSFTATETLMVTPVTEPLPPLPIGGDWSGTGESKSRSLASAGEDDVVTREYRHGDDLRRIHWRATAHKGELMVRREEQPWENRGLLLLDTRLAAHRGEGPASSFEVAVSAAASLGLHLGRGGFTLDLVTDSGQRVATSAGAHAAGSQDGLLLDALAVVAPSANRTLRPAGPVLRSAGEGLTVAVLGHLDVEEAAELARYRHGQGSVLAVVLDVASWQAPYGSAPSTGPAVDAATTVLRGAGWKVVTLRRGEQLSEVWPLVLQSSGRISVGSA
jgi:uncharacterized protein (DUF58 family)